MNKAKRIENEKKFINWIQLKSGGRRYWYRVKGRIGWKALYVKEVDRNEKTVRFYQEIYNEQDELMEIHQKFPEDTGHQRVKNKELNDNNHL